MNSDQAAGCAAFSSMEMKHRVSPGSEALGGAEGNKYMGSKKSKEMMIKGSGAEEVQCEESSPSKGNGKFLLVDSGLLLNLIVLPRPKHFKYIYRRAREKDGQKERGVGKKGFLKCKHSLQPSVGAQANDVWINESSSSPCPKLEYPGIYMNRLSVTGQHHLVLCSTPLISFEARASGDYNISIRNIFASSVNLETILCSIRKAVCMAEAMPFCEAFSVGRQLLAVCTKSLLVESHIGWLRYWA